MDLVRTKSMLMHIVFRFGKEIASKSFCLSWQHQFPNLLYLIRELTHVLQHLLCCEKWLRYYSAASSRKGHGIHSPFVFDFVTEVLNDKQNISAILKIESLGKSSSDNAILEIEDFGAGSAMNKTNRGNCSAD